ncbi:MAG: flagellar hook capping protein [Gammaproteobacteria bacterium]|nr:flagellar hook capping protein [Gammaproteobacteria bacterium]
MIDSIGASSLPQSQQFDSTSNQVQLGQEEFLEILMTQLTFQDPLKPMDNQEFIAQMAQFTNLEQTRQLSENSETLLTVQSSNQAIELIGKEVTVSADTETGTAVGTVTTVSFNQGVPVLSLKLADDEPLINVRLADVQSIRQ